MNVFWIMLAAGIITYLTRLSLIVLFGRLNLPDTARRALRFVPPAVLSAIIFPEVFLSDGQLIVGTDNLRLFAAAAAVVVAWRTKNVLLTIAAGMVVLLALQAWFGMG